MRDLLGAALWFVVLFVVVFFIVPYLVIGIVKRRQRWRDD